MADEFATLLHEEIHAAVAKKQVASLAHLYRRCLRENHRAKSEPILAALRQIESEVLPYTQLKKQPGRSRRKARESRQANRAWSLVRGVSGNGDDSKRLCPGDENLSGAPGVSLRCNLTVKVPKLQAPPPATGRIGPVLSPRESAP